MIINIIAVGKLKEKNIASLVATYYKRLQKHVKVNVIEVKESFIPLKSNEHDINRALLEESKRIISKVKERDYVILLAPKGKQLDSLAFSDFVATKSANSRLTFIIGSSYGVHEALYERANEVISFSELTFPHELFRLLLFEQLFRALKIINNETYHK